MSDFPFLNRTNLLSFQRHNRDGLSLKRQKLHFERLAFPVHVNNSADVTSFQSLVRNLFLQNHPVMLFDQIVLLSGMRRYQSRRS